MLITKTGDQHSLYVNYKDRGPVSASTWHGITLEGIGQFVSLHNFKYQTSLGV